MNKKISRFDRLGDVWGAMFARFVTTSMMLLLVGCSAGISVSTDFDSDVDFQGYKTWDWMAEGRADTGDTRIDDPKVRARIEAVITEGFAERGYRRDPSSPDFLINYYVAINEELNERNIANFYEFQHYGVFWPQWENRYTEVHDIGSMLIDILDPDEKKMVWRGLARTEINWQAGPKENRPIMQKAVRMMLKDFPPKPKKKQS